MLFGNVLKDWPGTDFSVPGLKFAKSGYIYVTL